MVIVCGFYIADGILKISNVATNNTFSLTFDKINSTDVDKIDTFFDDFNKRVKEKIDYFCVLMGNEYKTEFRKKFIQISKRQNKIANIRFIGVHEAKLCNAVEQMHILPSPESQLWIFDFREEFFYCTRWEFNGEQWKFKDVWQKEKTIKGMNVAPTINDLREMSSKLTTEIPPDIFCYCKTSGIDEKDFREAFSNYIDVKFEVNFDVVDWALIYAKYLSNEKENKRYKSDILITREINVAINKQNCIEASSIKLLPFKKSITAKTNKDDMLELIEDGMIAEHMTLKNQENASITLNININGIYSIAVETSFNNTLHDQLLVYNIPKKFENYDPDYYAVGIDLGTTSCSCAVIRRAGPDFVSLDPIQEAGPSRNLPSYVMYDEEEPHCGQIAVDGMRNKSQYIVYDSKRILGKTFDQIVSDPLWPFEIAESNNNVLIGVDTYSGRDWKSPEEVSAALLNHIKKEADAYEGTQLSEAVITIPSEFTLEQKQATLKAAEFAGWKTIHFIPEPVAAAIAYFSEINIPNNSKILICDCGGGTVDICVAKLVNEQTQILGFDGDSYLGGRDFDSVLFKYFNLILRTKYGINVESSNKKYVLKQKCQDIKHKLSIAAKAELDVDDFVLDVDEQISITREEFENLSASLLIRIQSVIRRAVEKTNISKNDINYVFQVGGGCRMPMIKNLLKEIFPEAKHEANLPLEWVVAHGASLYAYHLKTIEQ